MSGHKVGDAPTPRRGTKLVETAIRHALATQCNDACCTYRGDRERIAAAVARHLNEKGLLK